MVDRLARRRLVGPLAFALLAGIAGCAPGDDSGRLHRQAEEALARWTNAVAAAGAPSVFPVGELTRQVGTWEREVGDRYKVALMSGAIEAPPDSLPDARPPDGEVRWQDGTSQTVRLHSAPEALGAIRVESAQPCPDCVPLRVSSARLTSATAETTRGPADVPVWEFTIAGPAVLVTRVALAQQVTLSPPPWDSYDPPVGLRIDSATASADGRILSVAFVGSPYPSDQHCGADYSGEAVESTTAVVVIVNVRPHFDIGACAAVGARRTAEVTLASPLGDRAVLEVQQGMPVPVVRAR